MVDTYHEKGGYNPCGKWAVLNRETGKVFPYSCGRLACKNSECKRVFYKKRVRLIGALVTQYNLSRFFTLTLNREMRLRDAWEDVHGIWTKFRRRMRHKHEKWKFVAVLEGHKDGYPHIHGFTDVWMAQHEWTNLWHNSGGGRITWIERISGNISEYVSKEFSLARYIGKEQLQTARARAYGKRTLWRTTKMKADFELEPGGEYAIVQKNVFDGHGKLEPVWEKIYGK